MRRRHARSFRPLLRLGMIGLMAMFLAGCAGVRTERELRQFEGTPVRDVRQAPAVVPAQAALVTVQALDARGQVIAYGSGFHVAPDQVVTCFHVIEPAARLRLLRPDQSTVEVAGVFGADPALDAAVLWVTTPPPAGAVLSFRDEPAVPGEPAFALGAPRQLPVRLAEGRVLQLLDVGSQTMSSSISFSIPVLPGFSGGPMLDAVGRVIAVTGAVSASAENRFSLGIPAEEFAPLRAQAPVSFAEWRRRHPAPPYAAYRELSLGERASTRSMEEALRHYDRAIELRPDYTRAWSQKAGALMLLKRPTEAVDAFQRVLELEPSLPVPRILLALSLSRLGRHDEAVAHAEETVRRRPEAAVARFSLATARLGQGDLVGAFHAAREAVRLAPGRAQNRMVEGVLWDLLGQPGPSLTALREAARLMPERTEAWLFLGTLAYELGHGTEAAEALARATSDDSPNISPAWHLRSLLALQAGDTAAARAHLGRCLDSERETLRRSDAPEATLEAVDRLREMDLADARTHVELAGLFGRNRRIHSAMFALEHAVRLEPESALAWTALAQSLAGKRRADRAFDAARRAIALQPRNPAAYQALGLAHGLNNRLDDAREALNRSLQLGGTSAGIPIALAAVETRAGNPLEARRQMEVARTRDPLMAARYQEAPERFLPDLTALSALPAGE